MTFRLVRFTATRLGVALILGAPELFTPSRVLGQGITVQAIDQATQRPVPSAIVSLFGSADTALLARFSNDSGIVEIRTPTSGNYRVLVRAIGYRPEQRAVTVSPAGMVRTTIAMIHRQMLLRPVVVEADSACGDITSDGAETFRVWDNIRTALEANRLTESQGLVRMEIETYDRDLSLGLVEQSKRLRRKEVATRQPFSAAVPADLETGGYVKSIGGAMIYFAPEAKTLLSDEFAKSHCFSVRMGGAEESRAIGLAFVPKPAVRRPNISGVLWVDTASLDLTHLDFEYVNVPATASLHGVGGRLEFKRFLRGAWFISHWYIRTPRLGRLVSRLSAGYTPEMRDTLLGLRESGATARAMNDDEAGVVATGSGEQWDSVSVLAEREAVQSSRCADSSSKGTTTLSGSVRDRNGAPLQETKLLLSWNRVRLDRTGNEITAQNQGQVVEIEPDSNGNFVVCGLPLDVDYQIELTRAGKRIETRYITAESKPRKLEINFISTPSTPSPTLFGTVKIAGPSGGSIADAEISVANLSTRTDSTGHFELTGIPRGIHIVRVRRVGFAEQSKTVNIGDGTVGLTFALARIAPLLDTIQVRAARGLPFLEGFEDRRLHGFGTYITRDRFEKQEYRKVADILRSIPGLKIMTMIGGDAAVAGMRGGQGLGAKSKGGDASDYRRGAGAACYVQVFVDGTRVFAPAPNTPLFNINSLTPSEIEGIEYYRGPAETPVQYSTSQSECGTLLVWTRRGDPSK